MPEVYASQYTPERHQRSSNNMVHSGVQTSPPTDQVGTHNQAACLATHMQAGLTEASDCCCSGRRAEHLGPGLQSSCCYLHACLQAICNPGMSQTPG